jgi:hypothetical protein
LVSSVSTNLTTALPSPVTLPLAVPQSAATSPTAALAASVAGLPTTVAATAGTVGIASSPVSSGIMSDAQGQSMMLQMVLMICKLLCSMIDGKAGSASAFTVPTAATTTTAATTPTPAPAAAATTAASGAAGTTATSAGTAGASTGRLRIAQIDTFTGSTHGQEIANTLRSGGGDPSLAGKIDLLQFDIANGNGGTSQNINNALQNIVQRVQSGEQIDAVNMSLQDFSNGAQEQQTRALVDQLAALGVPVAIAAGNNGPNQQNQLGGANTFNVQSATNGQINATSGRGNVTADGQTTSFAAANLAPVLAAKKAQGQTIGQIRASL